MRQWPADPQTIHTESQHGANVPVGLADVVTPGPRRDIEANLEVPVEELIAH
jgi:hypothetical protein